MRGLQASQVRQPGFPFTGRSERGSKEPGAACGVQDREQLRECCPEATCAQDGCLSAGQAERAASGPGKCRPGRPACFPLYQWGQAAQLLIEEIRFPMRCR